MRVVANERVHQLRVELAGVLVVEVFALIFQRLAVHFQTILEN